MNYHWLIFFFFVSSIDDFSICSLMHLEWVFNIRGNPLGDFSFWRFRKTPKTLIEFEYDIKKMSFELRIPRKREKACLWKGELDKITQNWLVSNIRKYFFLLSYFTVKFGAINLYINTKCILKAFKFIIIKIRKPLVFLYQRDLRFSDLIKNCQKFKKKKKTYCCGWSKNNEI